jgi:predicted acetyltransferase
VHQLVYENKAGFLELMGFLASQIDQAEVIILNTQDDNFHFLLDYPHNGRPFEVRLHHQSNVQEVGICYRIINVRKTFEVLSERNFGDSDLKLKLTIVDTFYPINDGSTIIHFAAGTPELKENGATFEVEIKMNVAEFSSLIMGAIQFKTLYDYGLAEISDKMYLLKVDKLFQCSKPICMTEF